MSQAEPPPQKSLEDELTEVRERIAAIPPAERNVISPRLRSLTGILPRDFDAKKEYQAHVEQKYL